MKAKWQVVDYDGELIWDADTIAAFPEVRAGYRTPRVAAKILARQISDPEAPGPARAEKVA